MNTYQDLVAVGREERARMQFLQRAVLEHRLSPAYQEAAAAEQYYSGENPTIARYEKLLYDMQGRAHRDPYTANHKISSSFFQFAVDQENSYLLGNGVTFSRSDTKRRLGRSFDQCVQYAGESALIAGVSFGFWNLDHLVIFPLREFVPLYDEENGALSAGIRFWQVDRGKPLRCTLYELDGYTEYVQPQGEELRVLAAKRPYRQVVRTGGPAGPELLEGLNYPGLPIVPLYNGRAARSELAGRRNTIDALDLASSNMVNNVDEGSLIYWVLTNCAGMDDLDDARFIERLKTTHVAHADGDDGAKVTPGTIEAPFSGTEATINMLTRKLYADFQCFDASAVSAGNQTATAIRASYIPLDLKTDKFERYVTEFIHGVLDVAGIEDEPTYTRSQLINRHEETQTVLLGAPYYDREYVTKKLLTILGDGDQYEALVVRREAESLDRLTGGDE